MLEISPDVKEDLRRTREYMDDEFGVDVADNSIRGIIASLRKFQVYPLMGRPLTNLIDLPTDYMYFVIEKNYVFYRIEGKTVKIIRILSTRQDFMKALFGDE